MAAYNQAGQAGLAAKIRGLKEASAAFKRLPDVVRTRMLIATETTVREIARGAQARLEANPSIRTRALYKRIAWKISEKTGRGKVGVASGQEPNGDNPARRAHFVELGTIYMPAEPFMVPAADAEKDHYLKRCVDAGKVIERDMSIGRTL